MVLEISGRSLHYPPFFDLAPREAIRASDMQCALTPEEIEKRMDELARKYVETRDRNIIEELNRLSRQLQELEKYFHQ